MLVNETRLRAKMLEEGLDGIIATTLENVYYLTGVSNVSLHMFPHGGQCYAIVTPDRLTEPFIVSPTIDTDQFTMDSPLALRGNTTFGTFYREDAAAGLSLSDKELELQQRSDLSKAHASPADALIDALKQLGLADKKIGIDEVGISPAVMDAVADQLSASTVVPAASVFAWARRVKTAEEIKRLTASCRVVEQAIRSVVAIARSGVTEVEMAREFERSVVSQGAMPKFTLIRINGNAVFGQSKPMRTALKPGDLIWFDVGCVLDGYWSDIARNVTIGEPTERIRKIYDAMLIGEQAAIEQARPGMTGGELFDLTIEATRAGGMPTYRRHHVGHSIGVEVYEQPLIAPGNTSVIEEGTVINIETPYYEYGLGSLHVEDPFVVGADGDNTVLTALTRELIIVE
ncbi:MAG: peptidase M24 [Anaerolineaceae bacterium]|nr:peptidase M24 [Anaerolineaceae bacterium]